jgi:hypothetical protein
MASVCRFSRSCAKPNQPNKHAPPNATDQGDTQICTQAVVVIRARGLAHVGHGLRKRCERLRFEAVSISRSDREKGGKQNLMQLMLLQEDEADVVPCKHMLIVQRKRILPRRRR